MTIQANNETDGLVTMPSSQMHPELESFIADGDFSVESVDAFLSRVSSPLAERGALTFLWRGEAIGVQLLRWIHAGVDTQVFTRITGSDLWHLRVLVPDGGRFEYKLNVIQPHGENWIVDPRNPHRASDPFGENSVAMTYGYKRPDWSIARGAPRGSVEGVDVHSTVFDTTRIEQVYLPHGYNPSLKYPLVIIHDGCDYDDYAGLTVSLDNLIHQGDIPPLIACLAQAGDRMSEYPRGRRHARYIVGELLPTLQAQYSISDDPRERVLLGASLGAVAALSTALRFPGVFGGLILKSGSFILDPDKLRQRPHPVFQRVADLSKAIKRAPALPPTRAFVSTGELEGLADENRAMAEELRNQGVEVLFKSSWDGHHWHNWRDQLRDALMWVLRSDRND